MPRIEMREAADLHHSTLTERKGPVLWDRP